MKSGLMSKKKKSIKLRENIPIQKRGIQIGTMSSSNWDDLEVLGYVTLDKCPEVVTACYRVSSLISSMTIHLMENGENGDNRIINELSKKVDIYPNKYMIRKTFMESIVMNLLLYGNGNSIVRVHSEEGILKDLEIIQPERVKFKQFGSYGYQVIIDNNVYDPDELLHFVFNPNPNYPWQGQGITTSIKSVADNLKQASATEKGFLASNWKPSIIIKVDSNADEFASSQGRRKILDDYIKTDSAGEPWLIPAGEFSIEQVRPLSLNDLAIKDTIELNKKAVASIIGVPPFILGVGEYNKESWNNFINSTVQSFVKIIEQEYTKKLVYNPKWYWRFNIWSLLDWDVKTIANVFSNLYVRGIVDGNEVREKIGMNPREGLDELVRLENFIPNDMAGNQKKLNQNVESQKGEDEQDA